jgi:hypothetical protein
MLLFSSSKPEQVLEHILQATAYVLHHVKPREPACLLSNCCITAETTEKRDSHFGQNFLLQSTTEPIDDDVTAATE